MCRDPLHRLTRRCSGSWHVPRPAEICRAPAPTAYAPAGARPNDALPGRSMVPGLPPSTRIIAEGTVGSYGGKLALWNPRYSIEPAG